MANFDIRHNLDANLQNMLKLDGIFARARKSAMSSTGFYLKEKTKAFIDASGQGDWPHAHPLTKVFASARYGGKSTWEKRLYQGLYGKLNRLVRYKVGRDGKAVQILFSRTGRGEPGRVEPRFARIARLIQSQQVINITPKMRRFFAATKKHGSGTEGFDFFPIPKRLTRFVVPARVLFDTVFRQERTNTITVFSQKFSESLKRNMDRNFQNVANVI